MAKFIAGQTVVCIDAKSKRYLTEGKSYVVIEASSSGRSVLVKDDSGVRRGTLASRFQSKVAYEQEKMERFFENVPAGTIIPVPRGMVGGHMLVQAMPKKAKTPRTVKIDPLDAKVALTKMLKEVYGIEATVEQVIGSMDKSLELVLAA
ncbi:hypothetical protein IB265_34685 [Ensifer sp. ENS10]|uniref:hypothetical protein n=1 Tax=Ensifer sp. ENS10 TaxID=2769286 RepID=UPI001780A60A|nr:hypothetical protein [Ensifer sp. ENS10]MBD9511898.1 hypothetical protein [Ensifer sp. ENS10]